MWKFQLISLFLLISTVYSAIICPQGFSNINDKKCIQLFTDNQKHSDAVANCAKAGGTLVSIHNTIDNNQIVQFAANAVTAQLWLGLKCSQNNNPSSCLWDDQSGNAGDYNNFAPNQPLVDIGACVYLQLSGGLKGRWLSGDCQTMVLNYICEVVPTSPNTDTCSFKYNNYCYFPTLSEVSETEANFACQQACGSLVSIHSQAENNYIQSLFGNNVPNYVRIGALQPTSGVYSWSDGTNWDYSNIGFSNINFGSCMSMALKDNLGFVSAGQWTSSQCDTQLPFICKRPQGVQCGTTPGPTTMPNQCNGPQLYDNTGTFYSPGWPNSYMGADRTCSYLLDTPIGTITQIQFPLLTLDQSSYIEVFSRLDDTVPIVQLRADSGGDRWYNSTTSTMKVIFHPCIANCDQSGNVYRWQANFKPSVPTTMQPPLVTVTPDPANPSGCNATILSAPGSITSPNYPGYYPNYLDCLYHLSTIGGYRIELDFGAISTESCCDIIVVRDGPFLSSPELGRISGTYSAGSKTYQSSSNSMLVSFTTDSSGQSTGFTGTFRAV